MYYQLEKSEMTCNGLLREVGEILELNPSNSKPTSVKLLVGQGRLIPYNDDVDNLLDRCKTCERYFINEDALNKHLARNECKKQTKKK
jgi:hypothetical protein